MATNLSFANSLFQRFFGVDASTEQRQALTLEIANKNRKAHLIPNSMLPLILSTTGLTQNILGKLHLSLLITMTNLIHLTSPLALLNY